MKKEPIVIRQILNAPTERAWKAITDKGEMKKWYFDFTEFKPEVGFKFQFYGGTEERKYLHLCTVTDVIIGKKLTYSWKYEGFPGNSFVTFELSPVGDKTTIELTHSELESFPPDNPDFAKKNFIEGWNHIIGTSLAKFVERN